MSHEPTDPRVTAEVEIDPSAAVTRADDGRWVLTMHRDLRHDPARVWRMVTEPDQLARWSPVVPDRPLTAVGPATSRENPDDDPVDAEVLHVDAGVELVHRWGPALLRWTLTPVDGGTRLELHQTFDDGSMAASYAAGWRICLGSLAASHDADVERVCGPRALDYGWQRLHDDYDGSLA
jgi:uncharacterized protein YndB with AHSA1/START domain